jgi:hypothetical protein
MITTVDVIGEIQGIVMVIQEGNFTTPLSIFINNELNIQNSKDAVRDLVRAIADTTIEIIAVIVTEMIKVEIGGKTITKEVFKK